MNVPAESHEVYQESYAHRIWRHFEADKFARNGLRIVVALFIIAALAPFLANSHAIIRVIDGRVTFPIFPSLESIEVAIPALCAAGCIVYLLRSRFSRHPGLSFSLLIGVIALVEITLALTHRSMIPPTIATRPPRSS